jgi:hypothetical protein
MSSVESQLTNNDSANKTKKLFNTFFDKQIAYPSSKVDSVVGFFLNRGFQEAAAASIATVLLEQSKKDDINVMALLDTLSGYDSVQLSSLVTAVLNANRSATSKLGLRSENTVNYTEARNILS